MKVEVLKRYQPKVEADNTYRDLWLSRIAQNPNLIIVLLYIFLQK